MHDTLLLVKMSDGLGYLKNNVAGEVLAEICEFDDLMEQLAALHD